jgi:SNF2 family DNA or RNA helicase
MSPEYYAAYMRILAQNKIIGFKNPETFLSGYRRAVNSLPGEYLSPKTEALLKLIKKEKSVIYSNWLTYGQKPIANMLARKKITFRVYDGSLSARVRQEIIDDFNDGLYQVLIISGAGGTGINLKGVRKLVLLDPTWSPAILRQIEGRVARYKSHDHLPAAERHVDIYEMILLTPNASEKNWREDTESGDVLLYLTLEKKLKMEEEIYKVLKKMSIKCRN